MQTHHPDVAGPRSRTGLVLLSALCVLVFLWVVARLAVVAFG